MRLRWAMLLVPLVHILALELVRPQLLGPTAGTIRLDTVYGVLAFLLGRGLYGFVAIFPMILGAYLGTVLALASATPTPRRAVASGLAVCLVVSLALLALLTQGMGVSWTPATAATLTFWLVTPLVLYVIAGTMASWQITASWQRRRTAAT
jgi:hypothetical protein